MGHEAEVFDFTPEPWMDDAACKGLEGEDRGLFFGHDQEIGARKYCAGCPVTWECFSYAVRLQMGHGLWGGIPQRDRHQMLLHARPHNLRAEHTRRVNALRVQAGRRKRQ